MLKDLFGKRIMLKGRIALVTSGPTHEAIDPVRFLGNRSSGKQGHAIAAALARQGAQVTLVTGPTALPDPAGVTVIHVTSAPKKCSKPAKNPCRWTSRSAPPPWPTGAYRNRRRASSKKRSEERAGADA